MDIPLIENKRIARWIFRTHFTRNGVRYYARDYDKRAFRIPVYA